MMGDSEPGLRSFGASNAPIDPEFGQRGAFPGLDDQQDEDQLFYGPASDGLEYLRMVRREAHSVPKLLRVQQKDSTHAQSGPELGHRGRYEDGAYIDDASNASESDMQDADSLDEDDIQGIYYRNLLQRFMTFRELLAKRPNNAPLQLQLPKALQPQSRKPHWSYDLRRTAPTGKDLLPASQGDIILGLRRIELLLTTANLMSKTERTNLGAWSWTLLGRCRALETLDSEDVSVLRSLAKTALALSTRLLRSQNNQTGYERPEEADEGDADADMGSEDGEITQALAEKDDTEAHDMEALGELETARIAMLTRLQEAQPREDTSNTIEAATIASDHGIKDALTVLDIIVTLVGGAFGQSDLLDLRAAWP